jgi:cytochrome c peroxidase
MHTATRMGLDSFQSDRSPDKRYRTTPLKGLSAHMKGGFFHDGRFATLRDVVDYFNKNESLRLSDQEANELVEFLKSL